MTFNTLTPVSLPLIQEALKPLFWICMERYHFISFNVFHMLNSYPWDKSSILDISCLVSTLMSIENTALTQSCVLTKTEVQKVMKLTSKFFSNWNWLLIILLFIRYGLKKGRGRFKINKMLSTTIVNWTRPEITTDY